MKRSGGGSGFGIEEFPRAVRGQGSHVFDAAGKG